jgi:OOP family OmpA-OmpF porin
MPQSISEKDAAISSNALETPEKSPNGGNGQSDIAELRKILVQSEQVGAVLPSAIKKSAKIDNKLAEATLPIVEENIRQSAQRNPRVLAEAIFPIIGPAIRKAIAEALSQMVQSLNQTLEHSFSPQGLKWRLEAIQTGKPFAEIVLLNTLLYRVEEVFLIHKETGILLQHVSANPAESQDGDMVSAMLTAIGDFVHDSFKASEDATLDSLKIRDLSVWIENSPDAILAVVIRGNAPLTLRETLLEAIEEIQLEFEDELNDFKGDGAAFERTRPILQRCLKMQVGEEEKSNKSIFTPFNVLAGILGILLIISGFFYIRDYWRWSGFVERLRNQTGFVVTRSERGFLKHSISGLRDDLAANPNDILKEYGFDENDVEQNWKPYQDANPQFILQRAQKLLIPPDGVKFSFENGILSADGLYSSEWFAESKKIALALNGVRDFQIGFSALKTDIESTKIIFNCGTTDFAENQQQMVVKLTKDFENLCDLTRISQKSFRVEVEGHADSTGTDATNVQISQARADKISSEIFVKSEKLKQNVQYIKAVGIGSDDNNSECAVKFKVFIE